MDNLTLSIEDLYEEVKSHAMSEGAFSREEWHDSIEEVLDGKRETMEIDDDDDWQYITESLQSRYETFSKDVAVM
jgi:Zn-finger domain-containing protein